jgi:hypothetical protein
MVTVPKYPLVDLPSCVGGRWSRAVVAFRGERDEIELEDFPLNLTTLKDHPLEKARRRRCQDPWNDAYKIACTGRQSYCRSSLEF